MTGVVTTGLIPKVLYEGLNHVFGLEYAEHSMECNDLFEVETTRKAYEEDQQITGLGLAPVKAEGSSLSYDSFGKGYLSRYTNKTYGLGFIVTMEEMMDNLYKERGYNKTRALARSLRQSKETVCANIYNRAFNSAYVGGDGVELLSTAHPVAGGGTQSNELATAADLSESSLEDLCIQIANALDDRGLKIQLKPRSLHIPTALMFDAQRILYSDLQSGTANNDLNALKAKGMFPEGIKVNHYFDDNDAFFIRTDVMNGLKRFDRMPAKFFDDNDFDTRNLKYSGIERYVPGWTDWRALFGSPGA